MSNLGRGFKRKAFLARKKMDPELNGSALAEETPLLPVCGHCGAGAQGGAPIATLPLSIGALDMLVVFCGNRKCRAIHAVQMVGMQRPQPSGLVIP